MTSNKDIWETAVKGVKPLKSDGKTSHSPTPAKRLSRRKARDFPSAAIPTEGPLHQSPFDPRLYDKIASGKVKLDFKLDLHGMSEPNAYKTLTAVLEAAFVEGKRRGLVITGKGREGQSPIRKALPKWLSSPKLARIVSSFDFAAKRHGDDGAFYVLLRKLP